MQNFSPTLSTVLAQLYALLQKGNQCKWGKRRKKILRKFHEIIIVIATASPLLPPKAINFAIWRIPLQNRGGPCPCNGRQFRETHWVCLLHSRACRKDLWPNWKWGPDLVSRNFTHSTMVDISTKLLIINHSWVYFSSRRNWTHIFSYLHHF